MGRRLQGVENFYITGEQRNKVGLEINGKKEKFMIVSHKPYSENEYAKLCT
jgi:hypothetical protein